MIGNFTCAGGITEVIVIVINFPAIKSLQI